MKGTAGVEKDRERTPTGAGYLLLLWQLSGIYKSFEVVVLEECTTSLDTTLTHLPVLARLLSP